METERKKSFLISTAYFVTVLLIVFVVYRYLIIYLMPFIIGLALAVGLQKPAEFISKKIKIKKGTAAAVLAGLSYLALIGVIAAIGVIIFLRVGSISDFIAQITSASKGLFSFFAEKGMAILSLLPGDFSASAQSLPGIMQSGILQRLTGAVSSAATLLVKNIPGVLFSVSVTVVASCYIAKDFDAVRYFVKSFVPNKYKEIFKAVKELLYKNVFVMFFGYFKLMLITCAELFLGLAVLGVPGALSKAAIISVIDILPVLGTGTVLIPWGVYSILFDRPFFGLALLILYVIITVVRSFLEPKIIGHKVGIPPIVSLLILFFGLRLFGFLGMIALFITLVVIVGLYKNGTLK